MKAFLANVLLFAWFVGASAFATGSDWKSHAWRSDPDSRHLVLADGAGYRFRGGDVIPAQGEDGHRSQYNFRPRREKKEQAPAALYQPATRPRAWQRTSPSGYTPYYPVDPYLPFTTTVPFEPAPHYPGTWDGISTPGYFE